MGWTGQRHLASMGLSGITHSVDCGIAKENTAAHKSLGSVDHVPAGFQRRYSVMVLALPEPAFLFKGQDQKADRQEGRVL